VGREYINGNISREVPKAFVSSQMRECMGIHGIPPTSVFF